ncbi:MAG: hypothetical protein QNJ82_13050 [Gammaproteobacteria bacterium]|nr:hypothetical protein [Gammaproteobacteria bacterium]
MPENAFENIRRVKREVETELLSRPGVTGVDIGTKVVGGTNTGVPCIVVYVEEKRDISDEEAIPRDIQGVQTDVVERRFRLHSGRAGHESK